MNYYDLMHIHICYNKQCFYRNSYMEIYYPKLGIFLYIFVGQIRVATQQVYGHYPEFLETVIKIVFNQEMKT